LGPFDAEVLETVFTPRFLAADLVNLGFAQIYLTLMIDGIGSQPFSAVTLPPIAPPRVSCREMVIAASRNNFARPRQEIEQLITDLHAPVEPPPKKPKIDEEKGGIDKPRVPDASKPVLRDKSKPKYDERPPKPADQGDRKKFDSKPPRPAIDKSERPKGGMPSTDSLKAILAKIATASKSDDVASDAATPPASVMTTEKKPDHRVALRSALGSVLANVAPVVSDQVSAPAAVSIESKPSVDTKPDLVMKKTEPSLQTAVPTSVYTPLPHAVDSAEPDIKTIKKILGSDARVKSPFQ
jgi:hypothetical protein